MAIGARSQSARTYLEKHLSEFPDCDLEEMIKHGLRALRDTLPNEVDLTKKNCSLGFVGKDTKFTIYDNDDVEKYLTMIEGEEKSPGAGAEEEAAPMEEGGEGQEGDTPAPDQAPEVATMEQ